MIKRGNRALSVICAAAMVMSATPVHAANVNTEPAQITASTKEATTVVGDEAGSYVFAAADLEIVDLWGTEASIDADGKQVVEFQDKYAQIYYRLPEGVDGARIEKIKVQTSSKEFSIKLCADDGAYGDIGVVYGATEISKGSFDPDADLSTAKFLCFMNLDDEPQTKTIGNVTFVLKAADGSEAVEDEIKPVSSNTVTGEYVYNAKDLKIESEIGAQAEAGSDSLKIAYEDKYAQVLVEIPAAIDPSRLKSVTVNTNAPTKNFSVKLCENHDNYKEAGAVYETNTITEYDLDPSADKSKIKYVAFMSLSETGMNCDIKTVTFKLTAANGGATFAGIESDIPDLKDAIQSQLDEDFIVGAAICQSDLSDDQTMALVKKHFNAVTIGNELKPDSTFGYSNNNCPSPHYEDFNGERLYVPTLNFDRGDRILESLYKWNQEHPDRYIKVRGHVLTWHSQTPEWFFHEDYNTSKPYVDKATMTKRHEWYIKSVLEHYCGENGKYTDMFYGWDVVNEAVSDGSGTYRKDHENSSWWAVYKSNEFIINAFKFANKYAPASVELYYNDYNEDVSSKVKGIVQLLKDVKNAEGTRIDGFGMQGHYQTAGSPNKEDFKAAAKAYAAVVGKVQLTELDFKCSGAYDGTAATYDAENTRLAYRYKEIFEGIKELREEGVNFQGMTVWGLIDRNSWLQTSNSVGGSANGNRKQMPLLFDDDYKAKPAYWTFVDENQLAPQIKTFDILQSEDGSFENGIALEVGSASVVPVWNKDGLKVQFTVEDSAKDVSDEVVVYVEKNGQITKYSVARSAATETANGYKAVVNVPYSVKVADEVKIDFVVVNGDKKSAYNDYTYKQGDTTKYYANAIIKPFMSIKKGTVKVDGKVDEAWKNVEATPLTINLGSKVSADAKLLWDEENLYVFASVKDSMINKDSENVYEQDSFEVFIDENNHKSSKYEEDDKQYRVNYANEQSFNGDKCLEENIKSVANRTNDGYEIEFALKWTDIKPVAGQKIGLELQVNDADYSGSRIGTLSWYDTTGQGWDKPSVYGTAVLVDGEDIEVEEPTTEEPTTEEPTTEEPTTEEPTTEEPTTEEPTTEEPTIVEPTTEEPTTEEPSTEEPTTEEPSTEPENPVFGEVPGSRIPTVDHDQIMVFFKNEDGKAIDEHRCASGEKVKPAEWLVNNIVSEKNGWGQTVTDYLIGWRSTLDGKVYTVDKIPAVTAPVSYYPVFESTKIDVPVNPVEPQPTEPQPTEPQPTEPDVPVAGDAVSLSKVQFGKTIDLSSYDYKKITRIVVKFKGNATQFGGAVVLGNWVQQDSFNAEDCRNNTFTVKVKNPQKELTIYKWWSGTTLELDSVELFY